jgi:hypothetical protein
MPLDHETGGSSKSCLVKNPRRVKKWPIILFEPTSEAQVAVRSREQMESDGSQTLCDYTLIRKGKTQDYCWIDFRGLAEQDYTQTMTFH